MEKKRTAESAVRSSDQMCYTDRTMKPKLRVQSLSYRKRFLPLRLENLTFLSTSFKQTETGNLALNVVFL